MECVGGSAKITFRALSDLMPLVFRRVGAAPVGDDVTSPTDGDSHGSISSMHGSHSRHISGRVFRGGR